MGWVSAKMAKIFGPIIAVLAAVAAVFFYGRKTKSDEIQAKVGKETVKITKKGKSIEKDNRDAGADARRDRLRKDARDSK